MSVPTLLLFLAQQSSIEPLPPGTSGYGAQLLRSLFALLAVCALAWFVLRQAAKHGLGKGTNNSTMQVLERTSLGPKHALYLVRVGARTLLLGVGGESAPTLLAELEDTTKTEGHTKESERSFREVLRSRSEHKPTNEEEQKGDASGGAASGVGEGDGG